MWDDVVNDLACSYGAEVEAHLAQRVRQAELLGYTLPAGAVSALCGGAPTLVLLLLVRTSMLVTAAMQGELGAAWFDARTGSSMWHKRKSPRRMSGPGFL